MAGTDAAEVEWFTREQLPALNLAYDADDVVRKGLDRAAAAITRNAAK